MVPLAVIWKYDGEDRAGRLREIEDFDYPDLKVIPITPAAAWGDGLALLPRRTGACLFWIDNHRPVGKDFIRQMVHPLLVSGPAQPVLHIWAGNALAVSRKLIGASGGLPTFRGSIWGLVSPIIDAASAIDGIRDGVQIAFSSIERLAPMSLNPAGVPN